LNLRLLAVGLVLVGCGEDALPIGADVPSRDTGRDDVTVARQDTAGDISRVDLPVTDTGRDAEADALEDPSMDVPSDVTQAGGVVLFEVRAPGVGELESGGITAGFDRMRPEPETPPIAEIGSCVIRHTSEGGDLFEEGPSFDAGLIEITVGGTAYTLEYVDDRYVSSVLEDQNEVFAYGAAIAVSAAGGFEVDAFEVSLVAPGDPVITEPVWGAFSSHDRANALRVDWAGAAGTGTIVSIVPVQVFPDPGIADGNAITCTVDDTGTFTVPVEALAYLPEAEGLGGGSVALTVIRFVNETVVAGATEVTGNATASHTIVGAIE
jgi:hypothetical protein